MGAKTRATFAGWRFAHRGPPKAVFSSAQLILKSHHDDFQRSRLAADGEIGLGLLSVERVRKACVLDVSCVGSGSERHIHIITMLKARET
jgi:hypothetical protein